MKRHNFFLPVELVESLRVVAAHKDTTVSEVIRIALQKYLDNMEPIKHERRADESL